MQNLINVIKWNEQCIIMGNSNRDILNLTGTTNLGQGRSHFRNNIAGDLLKNLVMA